MSLQVGEPSEDAVTNVERVSGDTPDLKRGLWTGVDEEESSLKQKYLRD